MWAFLGKFNRQILFCAIIFIIRPVAGKPAETVDGPQSKINKGGSESANTGSESINRSKRSPACGPDGANGGPESLTGESRNAEGGSESMSDGTGNLRLLGGAEIVLHSYPWLVWVESANASKRWCAGIIIGPSAVATAGACVVFHSDDVYSVTAGDHDRDKKEGSEQKRAVKEVKVVQKVPGNTHVRLALLRMNEPFKLNRKVQIAKIPNEDYKIEGSMTTVGWGRSDPNVPSTVPLSLNFKLMPQTQCNPRYDGEFCAEAGNPKGTAGCFMDVGGPTHQRNLVVALLTSYEQKCGVGPEKFDDTFLSTSMFAKEIEDFAGNSRLKCNDENDVLFGVATNLMADICDQTKKFEETQEIQPPLINDLNNTIECAHVTWTKSGHGCFDYICPDDW